MTTEIRDYLCIYVCIYIYIYIFDKRKKKENRIRMLNRKRVINYIHEFRK